MARKLHGLGRGLDALLPEEFTLANDSNLIPVADIDPNPNQPRRTFADDTIRQLAQSIREQGVLQPVLVTPVSGGRYRIVAGERRWRAARMADLESIPCIVRELDAVQQSEIALIENLQREDLNPLETAQGIRSLMDQCGYTQEAVAARLGKSRPAVANLLRLLTLPEEVLEMIRRGSLSAGHAKVLVSLPREEDKILLARKAAEKEWSVRRLEEAIDEMKRGKVQLKGRKELPPELFELENRIRETVGLHTELKGSVKKGRIVLKYDTAEELERLNDLLGRIQ